MARSVPPPPSLQRPLPLSISMRAARLRPMPAMALTFRIASTATGRGRGGRRAATTTWASWCPACGSPAWPRCRSPDRISSPRHPGSWMVSRSGISAPNPSRRNSFRTGSCSRGATTAGCPVPRSRQCKATACGSSSRTTCPRRPRCISMASRCRSCTMASRTSSRTRFSRARRMSTSSTSIRSARSSTTRTTRCRKRWAWSGSSSCIRRPRTSRPLIGTSRSASRTSSFRPIPRFPTHCKWIGTGTRSTAAPDPTPRH